MSDIELEHVNVTVSDPQKSANMLCALFGWKIRWHGQTPMGLTYHVGTEKSYIAVYRGAKSNPNNQDSYSTIASLNHIAVVVDDLDEIENRVKEAGFIPQNHGNYEPGRRFYFDDQDGIEFEVVSYRS